ncbi:MAG: hypothetical protein ABT15_30320 [Pseudonocardia sp. SCN 73-27]|nr:MAG: hypothetical protein ABT15_30320 [Pseudonocardia sp. SCN 73-27]
MLPLLVLCDIAICVALYFLMGWPALLFAVPLAISTVVILVVLQGTAMLRGAVRTRTQTTHQVVEGSTYDSSGPTDWDDTFSSGPSNWDDPGHSHHTSSSQDHHWHSHPSSHDPGSWSSDSGASDSGSSDSGSSSSSSSD